MSGDHNMYQKAPIKGEGQPVFSEKELAPYKGQIETTYVERRVPVHLEGRVHRLIDKFLKERGYDPEEI